MNEIVIFDVQTDLEMARECSLERHLSRSSFASLVRSFFTILKSCTT